MTFDAAFLTVFSELFAPVSIGVRTIAKTVRILERNQLP